jgi:hypothetical protein
MAVLQDDDMASDALEFASFLLISPAYLTRMTGA